MKAIGRRLLKLENRCGLGQPDGSFTLEEVCRALWHQDEKGFRKIAEHSAMSLFIPQFEREDTGW